MKPKEYVKQFGNWHPDDFDKFVETLKKDIQATIETVYTTGNNRITLARMDSLIREAKQKFENIQSLLPQIPDGVWKHIRNTTLLPTRDKLCAEEISANRKARQKEEEWEASFSGFSNRNRVNEDFINFLIGNILGGRPEDIEAKTFFNLPDNYTADDVNRAYRKQAMTAHPDHGGTDKKFNHLTEMKERALRCLPSVPV